MIEIRHAEASDLPSLPAIEVAAGAAFRTIGMDTVADDDPPTLEVLRRYQQAGRSLVAREDGRVVAYLLLDVVAGAAHIEQVTVHPDVARRRVGRDLIAAAERWADDQGLTSLTLTTFRNVPWNAPYYTRLGFVVVPDAQQSAELRAVRRAERQHGLDAWPRVVMRRIVTPASAH